MPSSRQLRWESRGHVGLGILAGLSNLGLLLEKRERDSLPPENDANPTVILIFPGKGRPPAVVDGARKWPEENLIRHYWSSYRVMDTLNDLREYQIGQTIAWFGVLAAGIAIGWGIWG